MQPIKGIVKIVATTGGIKLEGKEEWFNPIKKIRDRVTSDLKGKEVELTMTENGKVFTFIKVVGTQATQDAPKQAEPKSKDDYWERRLELDRIRQEQITRAGSLNTAVEILRMSDKPQQSAAKNLEDAKKLAEEIERWIKQ